MIDSLPPDWISFARSFYSDESTNDAVEQFLRERTLDISDFAKMTEREFTELFKSDPTSSSDFAEGLNYSRIIPGLTRRLSASGITLLPNESVYVRGELRSSDGSSSVSHRVLIHKDGSVHPLCGRMANRMRKWSVMPFGQERKRHLCSLCSAPESSRGVTSS